MSSTKDNVVDMCALLAVKHDGGILCHQVNRLGVMGAGIAKQIARAWPPVLESYKAIVKKAPMGHLHLHMVEGARERSHPVYIANLFAQDGIGGGDNGSTDEWALKRALEKLALMPMVEGGIAVYAPYRMSCGHGRGDWNRVRPLVEAIIPQVLWCRN